MQSIELECPQCKSVLELDAGFAGGVCRCSNCGTLMTVPTLTDGETVAAAGRRDRPDRPDRPDAPGIGDGATAEESAAVEPVAAGPIQAEEITSASADGQTFTTASGRTIRLKKRMIIPTAKAKRRAIRFGIIGAFVAVIAVLVAATVFAVMALSTGDTPQSAPLTAEQQVAVLDFNPEANPFELTVPHALGIPLESPAVIVVDISAGSSSWFGLVSDAIVGAMRHAEPGQAFQVILASERGVTMFPADGPGDLKRQGEELFAFLDNAIPSGVAPPYAAMAEAMKAKPRQIVLISSQSFQPLAVRDIADTLGEDAVQFDVVMVSGDGGAIKELVEHRGGKFRNIPASRLTDWYRSAGAAIQR